MRFLHCFLLLLLPNIISALTPRRRYSSAVKLSPTASFYFTIDLESSLAHLALHITDPLSRTDPATPAWVGFGFSEPASSSVRGADMVTAHFSPFNVTGCTMADRHVPFVPFPLNESTLNAPSLLLQKDDCQEDGSWVLHRCERDPGRGDIVLEVTRPLSAHDVQDRPIAVDDINSVVYVYGDVFGFDETRTGSKLITLHAGRSRLPVTPLPDDVDGFVDVVATDFKVPKNSQSIYACTAKKFPLPADNKRMIVAVSPILKAEIDMVKHFKVLLCAGADYADNLAETVECGVSGAAGAPITDSDARCSVLLYTYGRGATRMVMPEDVGFIADNANRYIVLETHYENPREIRGNTDRSGVRIHYTDTMRKHEAGTLRIGDVSVSLASETVSTDVKYQFTCPSECTKRMNGPINIFMDGFHMHKTGRAVFTNKFDENGTFIEKIGQVSFWNDDLDYAPRFDTPITLKPGEQLSLTCIFDTSKLPETKWGYDKVDEICLDFISYWPVRKGQSGRALTLCSFKRDENENLDGTVCDNVGKMSPAAKEISAVPNPKFEDTEGAETTFGDPVEVCEEPSQMPSTDFEIEGPLPVNQVEEPVGTEELPLTSTAEPVSQVEDSPFPSVETSPQAVEDAEEREESSPEPSEDDNVCFPGSALVELKDGSSREMRDLQIGDLVLVAEGLYSPVVLFTHADHEIQYQFLQVETEHNMVITLTDGHYIYSNKQLVEARKLKVGDKLKVIGMEDERVANIKIVNDVGLFAPQTAHGDIVVNGIIASTYTKSVPFSIAHGLLAPVRWIYVMVKDGLSALEQASK